MSLSAAFCVAISLIILIPVEAQETIGTPAAALPMSNSLFAKAAEMLHPPIHGCTDVASGSPGVPGVRARACFYAERLTAPGLLLHAAFSSSFSEWRNSPSIRRPDEGHLVKRFAGFYEQKSARSAGEFLAGYLHHEDFRPRQAGAHSFLARTKEALVGVVLTPGESGGSRIALIPIAGAFSSGVVAASIFPNHGMWEGTLRRSGATYGCYFGSALVREFKPELTGFSNKLLKRYK